jgi:hypothetical protein
VIVTASVSQAFEGSQTWSWKVSVAGPVGAGEGRGRRVRTAQRDRWTADLRPGVAERVAVRIGRPTPERITLQRLEGGRLAPASLRQQSARL